MSRTAAIALFASLTVGCAAEDTMSQADSDVSTADGAVTQMDESGHEMGDAVEGELPGTDPVWTPTEHPGGAYWMEYLEVYEATEARPLEAGWGEMVAAPQLDGVVQMWGFAPLETDGETLRMVGETTDTIEGLDCTMSFVVEAYGQSTSPQAFVMSVEEMVTITGADCEANGIDLADGELYVYDANFSYEVEVPQ